MVSISRWCMHTLLSLSLVYWSNHWSCGAEDIDLHCSQLVLDSQGHLYAEATLTACAAAMSAPSMPVSYNSRYSGNLTVSNQLSLNNIININEVDSVMEIDFYYRQSWEDPRWVMLPEFWALMDPRLANTGMDIYNMFSGEHREDPLSVWVPDAWFQDIMDFQVQAQTMKLYPNGTIFYSRHCLVTLKQAQLDLAKYPLDYQLIELKLLSYGLTAQHMKMVYSDPPIEYLYDADGGIVFGNNAIWEHKAGYFNASIKTDEFLINGYLKTYETLYMKIYIERQGTGVLMRFAMPILILLILAGLTFWANFETRIDTTMTILLSVSALYVVILGSIPQVGYLTDFDLWIFHMFIMLSACVFAHQLVVNSFRKVEQWPFRAVIIRFIEMGGRVLIIPLSIYMFGSTFDSDDMPLFGSLALRVPLAIGFVLLMVREAFGVKKVVIIGLDAVCDKIRENERRCSRWEYFIVNLVFFRMIDFTSAPYKAKLKRMKRMNAGNDAEMELPTLNTLHDNNENVRSDGRRVSYSVETENASHNPTRRASLLERFRRKSLYDSDDEM